MVDRYVFGLSTKHPVVSAYEYTSQAFQPPLARMSSKKPGQKSQLFENTLYALNCVQRAQKACAPQARSRSTV